MTTYQYTDHHGDHVTVRPQADGAWVTINEGRGGAAVAFNPAEAERFAEAVMRASEQAEREAEDARAVAFWAALNPGYTIAEAAENIGVSDRVREQYRAAREFFAREEVPAPRVLQYGDPEPDRNTKWRDTGGNVWSFGDICHRDYPVWRFESATGSSFGRWTHLDSCFFPMTEVTK